MSRKKPWKVNVRKIVIIMMMKTNIKLIVLSLQTQFYAKEITYAGKISFEKTLAEYIHQKTYDDITSETDVTISSKTYSLHKTLFTRYVEGVSNTYLKSTICCERTIFIFQNRQHIL